MCFKFRVKYETNVFEHHLCACVCVCVSRERKRKPPSVCTRDRRLETCSSERTREDKVIRTRGWNDRCVHGPSENRATETEASTLRDSETQSRKKKKQAVSGQILRVIFLLRQNTHTHTHTHSHTHSPALSLSHMCVWAAGVSKPI